nr:MAG TPA: helix-turn-helix domain protein [Caudoviricetes sp.]
MTLNQEIRKRRIAKGISIRRLAELTGLSSTTIVNFENGSGARMEKVMAMIDALGCKVVIVEKEKTVAL